LRNSAYALQPFASGRNRLLGLLALLFVAAQLIVAAHAASGTDYLLDHSPTSCAACLAGSSPGDPTLLTVSAEKPIFNFSRAVAVEKAERLSPRSVAAAHARAPPSC